MPAKDTLEADVLRATPVLSGCTAAEQRALAGSAQRRSVAAHEVVFTQGEPCKHCYVLARGQIKLERVTGTIRSRVVGFAAPGDLLDEAALFVSGGHATTAIAVTRCEVLLIPASTYVRFVRRHPRVAWATLLRLSAQVRDLSREMERLVSASAEQKLAAYLLSQHEPVGAVDSGAGARRTQRDLASYLAVTPETLSRTLGKFRRRRWVEARRGRIEITDPQALQKVAEPGGE